MAPDRKTPRNRRRVDEETRLRSLGEFDERDRLPALDWKRIKRVGREKRRKQPGQRGRRGRMARLRLGLKRWMVRLRING